MVSRNPNPLLGRKAENRFHPDAQIQHAGSPEGLRETQRHVVRAHSHRSIAFIGQVVKVISRPGHIIEIGIAEKTPLAAAETVIDLGVDLLQRVRGDSGDAQVVHRRITGSAGREGAR